MTKRLAEDAFAATRPFKDDFQIVIDESYGKSTLRVRQDLNNPNNRKLTFTTPDLREFFIPSEVVLS